MTGDVTRQHYERIAACFDENWAHSSEYVDWMTGCITRRLQVHDGELAADVGCGTGLYARGLAEHAAVVVCAEPSAAMLGQVPPSAKLLPVQASAEDLAAGRVVLPYESYDAILIKEVLHHVDDRAGVIAGLAGLLKPGGRMLVVMLPRRISYPLFAAALRLFDAHQPDPADLAGAMRAAGLHAELSFESFHLSFPTERYLRMVRDRYMSLLASFSDVELEAGIAEITRTHPGERIDFPDTYAFVLGTRP